MLKGHKSIKMKILDEQQFVFFTPSFSLPHNTLSMPLTTLTWEMFINVYFLNLLL